MQNGLIFITRNSNYIWYYFSNYWRDYNYYYNIALNYHLSPFSIPVNGVLSNRITLGKGNKLPAAVYFYIVTDTDSDEKFQGFLYLASE